MPVLAVGYKRYAAQILTVGLSSSFLRSHPPGPPNEGGPLHMHVLIFGGKEDYWQNRPGCFCWEVGGSSLTLSSRVRETSFSLSDFTAFVSAETLILSCLAPHSLTATRDAAKDSLRKRLPRAVQTSSSRNTLTPMASHAPKRLWIPTTLVAGCSGPPYTPKR